MYGRIVLDIEGEAFDEPLDDAKEKVGAKTDADIPAGDLRKLCDPLQDGRREAHRRAVPAGADGAAPGRDRGGVRARGTAPGPSPTAPASASRTTSAPR